MKGIIFCVLIVSLIHFSLTQISKISCNASTKSNDDDFAVCGREEHSLSEGDRELGWTHCCLFKRDSGSTFCYGITDDQYEHIKNFKKYYNEFEVKDGEDEVDKIKCRSNYLSYSLFIIALFALIF